MNQTLLLKELEFKAVRSSGAGGQHVNKVSSKVELSFNLTTSLALSEREKEIIFKQLQSKLTKENILILSSQESRSQHQNKKNVTNRLLNLLTKALTPQRKRFQTKPTRSSKRKRLDNKKQHSEKKENRKKPDF